jgi:hypothetical protein
MALSMNDFLRINDVPMTSTKPPAQPKPTPSTPVDASDRKFYVQAAANGNDQALKDFDAALDAQSKPAPQPTPQTSSSEPKPYVKPERAEDPSDQKFYNMAADRQNNIIDLENRAASLQRDIDALGTSGGYATDAMQAELAEVEAELATLQPPARESADEPSSEPLSSRQKTIDALSTASPGAAQAMQAELDADVADMESRADQLRQNIDALGTSGGYATEAMQAELNEIEAELADLRDDTGADEEVDDSRGLGPRSSGGRSFDEPIPEPSYGSAFAVALPVAGGLAIADGPLPFGDAAAGGLLVGVGIGVGIAAGYHWLTSSDSPDVHKTEGLDDVAADSAEPSRPADRIGQIAEETGLTAKEVRDKIHEAKENLPRGTGVRNPDVVVDLDDGEIYPKIPGGGYGDSIGNIYD